MKLVDTSFPEERILDHLLNETAPSGKLIPDHSLNETAFLEGGRPPINFVSSLGTAPFQAIAGHVGGATDMAISFKSLMRLALEGTR